MHCTIATVRRSPGWCVVVLLALAGSAGVAVAQPAWYDNGAAKRGFVPGISDFYQHQLYAKSVADNEVGNWESSYPNRGVLPQIGAIGGWCRPTAMVDVLARLQDRGFKGVTEANINAGGAAWQAAGNKAIQDVQAAISTTGMQAYLDARKPANMIPDGMGGMKLNPDRWANGLKFDQFMVVPADTANTEGASKNFKKGDVVLNGKIQTAAGADQGNLVDGIVYKDGGNKVDTFTAFKLLMLAEQSPSLMVLKDTTKTYSDTLWWGNFHYLAGAGVSEGGGKSQIFATDPDSNPEHKGDGSLVDGTGNRSAQPGYKLGSSKSDDAGDGGWVFHELDRATQKNTIVDAVTGAAADLTKKAFIIYGYRADGTPVFDRINDDGVVANPFANYTTLKGDDANIDKRKFVAADAAAPVGKTALDKADPAAAAIKQRFATFEFDTSAPDKAFTIRKSNDKDGAITTDGRYVDININRVETIGIKTVKDALGARPAGAGLTATPLTLISSLATTVDAFQIVSITAPAADTMSLHGSMIADSAGGLWTASFINAGMGAVDAWGNTLTSGAWQFDFLSGVLGGLPAPDLSLPDATVSLNAFVDTLSTLTDFYVFSHAKTQLDIDGNAFGGYWLAQAYGIGEELFGDQTADIIPTPGAGGLAALGALVLARRRRGA